MLPLRVAARTVIRRAAVSTSASASASSSASSSRAGVVAAAAATAAAGAALFGTATLYSSDDHLVPAEYPWSHLGWFDSFDHKAIRRGFQVYKQVCSTCHSVDQLAWRNLVGEAYTEKEMKEMAAAVDVVDGPGEDGEMFERPGKLSDKLPKPYANENQARFANNGALPPDLSLVVKAREHHEDYVFSLLTGYKPAPPGVTVRDGMHYNPYFPGGMISMAPPLSDGLVEIDGEPVSLAQAAKDVTVFLSWAAEPKQDERKKMGMKVMFALGVAFFSTLWLKRFKWNVIKHRTITYGAMPDTLVKYETPVLVSTQAPARGGRANATQQKRGAPAAGAGATGKAGAVSQTDDILDAILPPREWEEEGQLWVQRVSPSPATRLDVIQLQEQLDQRLRDRQARETGICPIRQELYSQVFDELIRQVTVNCAERGLLLLRIRNELKMTLAAYQTLYESSIAFGMRKALQAEQGKAELEAKVEQLTAERDELKTQAAELRSRIESMERMEAERRAQDERKHQEEIAHLKQTNQQFKQQLDQLLAPAAGGKK